MCLLPFFHQVFSFSFLIVFFFRSDFTADLMCLFSLNSSFSNTLCAIIQCLINRSINTSLKAPGSVCVRARALLITSASTTVNLDHCDANLRRCSHPGEAAGSLSLIERGVGVWEGEAEDDECVRKAEREGERALFVSVIVCDDETTGLASVTQEPTNLTSCVFPVCMAACFYRGR